MATAVITRLRELRADTHHADADEVLALAKPLIQNGQVKVAGPESWDIYEQAIVAALEASDDAFATDCLVRLSDKFPQSGRVHALKGMALECSSGGPTEALKFYSKVLAVEPTNVPILKRRIACTRASGRTEDAIELLVSYLDIFYSDADAWLELADLYKSLNLRDQAAFALAEVVLLKPFDYRAHAAYAEMQYASSQSGQKPDALTSALESFLRGLELNDGSLRNLCGVKACCTALQETKSTSTFSADELRRIDVKATTALAAVPAEAVAKQTSQLLLQLLRK